MTITSMERRNTSSAISPNKTHYFQNPKVSTQEKQKTKYFPKAKQRIFRQAFQNIDNG